MTIINIDLTPRERKAIATILERRANEIAMYKQDLSRGPKDLASVDYALELEIVRLRHLAARVDPAEDDGEAA